MAHTAVLHFCGKRKPWKKDYTGHFAALYQHYMNTSALYAGAPLEESHDRPTA